MEQPNEPILAALRLDPALYWDYAHLLIDFETLPHDPETGDTDGLAALPGGAGT